MGGGAHLPPGPPAPPRSARHAGVRVTVRVRVYGWEVHSCMRVGGLAAVALEGKREQETQQRRKEKKKGERGRNDASPLPTHPHLHTLPPIDSKRGDKPSLFQDAAVLCECCTTGHNHTNTHPHTQAKKKTSEGD